MYGSAPFSETGEPLESASPLPEHAWTERFMGKAALVADHVEVRGPRGLLDHTVVQHDPQNFVHETSTLPTGFWQRTSIRLDRDIYDPIRAQLDAMQIMALREIVLLEQPGDVPVRVVATGDVYYHEIASGTERRGERVELIGQVE